MYGLFPPPRQAKTENRNDGVNNITSITRNRLNVASSMRRGRLRASPRRVGENDHDDSDDEEDGGGGNYYLLDMRRAVGQDNDNHPNDTEHAHRILSASVQLVDISVRHGGYSINDDSYTGIAAEFCELNFNLQKSDPSGHPMFRDVLSQSTGCTKRIRVDFAEAVELARLYDSSDLGDEGGVWFQHHSMTAARPTILTLRGAVFHES